MAKLLYCWRCKADIPMLDAHEWDELAPHFYGAIRQIQDYRRQTNASLAEARRLGYGRGAIERYFEMTGYRETNPDNLWHHKIDLFGPACAACGKPLRTPRAKFCVECGTPRA